MELQSVCELAFTRRDELAAIRPYGSGEAAAFEQANGGVSGEITGTVKLTEQIRRRADGIATVELHGLITTAEGPPVAIRATGTEDSEGAALLAVGFDAQDARFRWLNGLACIASGHFDRDAGTGILTVSRPA